MRVQFWGTRGSIATPGPTTLRYGGNTSCVELRTQAGTLLVFDCGTGARLLGQSLLARGGPIRGSILLGHSHWDHIQGFPFFAPIFLPEGSFTIYAPSGGDKRLSEVLSGQMEYTYFPVSLDQLQSSITFQDLGEDTFNIGEATVQTQYLNHTALTLAYRVSVGGATVVYATDHEPHARQLWQSAGAAERRAVVHHGDQRHIDFLAGADLVIHDSQYTEQEYEEKIGWGHSSVEYAVDVCAEAGVKRLALFHHDPTHDDARMDRLVADCQRRAERTGADLAVFGACEGRGLYLREHLGEVARERLPSGPSLPERARVLIAEDDLSTRGLLAELLADDDYELIVAADGQQALALVESQPPDLVLLDLEMPRLDGREVCRALRTSAQTAGVPVIMLTASDAERDIAEGFEEGATDYITKPFAPAMVRTRVRSWLLRSEAPRAAAASGDGRP